MLITKEPIDIWNHSRQTDNMTLYLKSIICENVLEELIELGITSWLHATKCSLYYNTKHSDYWDIDANSANTPSLDDTSYEVESISEESSTNVKSYKYRNSIGHFRVL